MPTSYCRHTSLESTLNVKINSHKSHLYITTFLTSASQIVEREKEKKVLLLFDFLSLWSGGGKRILPVALPTLLNCIRTVLPP